jgi:diacylglycerol kinase (ATP)
MTEKNPRIKVIVNPRAGWGHAAEIAPLIADHLRRLGADFELVHTRVAGEAISLAHNAAEEGFGTIVAVGGDGTSHEVVNGLMGHAAHMGNGHVAGTLGCIPAGSGNDFAVMNGAPVDVEAACRQIVQGKTQQVDVGRVTIDGTITRYFDNAVGIGFDALVTMATKTFPNLRGFALYVPAVLKTVFVTLSSPTVRLTLDEQMTEVSTLMTVVCNGPREGGTFLVAPNARADDGLFDVITVEKMSRLSMLGLIPRFMKGTHLSDPRIRVQRAQRIKVESEREPLFLHVDGEILCDHAHTVEVEMLPSSLCMIAPSRDAASP